MPIIGLSLVIQLLCVLHAMRHGRNPTWIMVILFLPLLGSAAYFVMEILPGMQGNRHVRSLRAQAAARIDPEREVRAARDALDLADTIANRLRLADALAALGRGDDAIPLYREALSRTPGTDPRTEAKLAQALFDRGEADEALALIDAIPVPGTVGERDRLTLLRARIYDHLGRRDEALALYADIVTRMTGEEARCRYAALLLESGQTAKARAVLEEVEARMKRLDRLQRAADAEMYRWATEKLRELRAAG